MTWRQQAATRAFYDAYWPANVPDFRRTREHVLAVVPEAPFLRALDAGCGTGVCSLALAERARGVVALDLSGASLRTARGLARDAGVSRLSFAQASLLQLPFPDAAFDLVWSWGAVHHTADPHRALDELARVLRPGGTLILALYWRTVLTPLHEGARRLCLRLGPAGRRRFIAAAAAAVRAAAALGWRHQVRDDNADVRSQVEDWFFVPEKHFFTPRQVAGLLAARGLTCQVVYARTGRFKSSSNFVVRGLKAGGAAGGGPPPLRAGAELRERVKALYLRDYAGANRLDPEKVVGDALSPLRFHEQRESLRAAVGPLEGKRVLEVGCGFGAFLAYGRQEGLAVTGVEIDAPTAALARDLLRANGMGTCPVAVGAGEALPFRTGTFDVVYSNSVVEHVRDPGRVLREAVRVLRPGGRFHFIVPSYASFYESHYGIFWLPHLPRALAPLYVRLWGRDPRCLAGITFVTPGRLARALRGLPGIRILGWGTEVFLRRMATLEFSEWGDLGRVKAWVGALRRLGLNRLAARLCVACGWYNPIILTVEKV